MPRTIQHNDDWEGDRDDSEWTPDEDESAEWHKDTDDDDTIPCPHCGRAVYEGAERCPNCENYISEEDAPRQARPLWIIVGGVICLAIVILWIWQG